MFPGLGSWGHFPDFDWGSPGWGSSPGYGVIVGGHFVGKIGPDWGNNPGSGAIAGVHSVGKIGPD